MALKSYRLKTKKSSRKKNKSAKGLLRGGVTAVLGVALFSEAAAAFRRI